MAKATTNVVKMAMGIDVGDKNSHYAVVDESGDSVAQGSLRTTPDGFKKNLGGFKPMRVAFETGTHAHWIKDVLKAMGHEVIVANARKVELITKNDRKSDKLDASLLARLARIDPRLLSPVTLRNGEAQDVLVLIRARESLVASRTKLINAVRGLIKARGARLRSCSTASFHKKTADEIPDELRSFLEPMIQIIQRLSEEIKAYKKKIEKLSETQYPVTHLLRQVSGVGPITSLVYVLVMDNPRRFAKARNVGAYLGLVPKRKQSGDRDPELRISKAGHPLLRRLLVQSSQYILGKQNRPDTDLRRFGYKIIERGGKHARNRAVVAVARKLAVLLHRLWVTAEVYEPLRNAQRDAAGKTEVA